MGTNYGMLLIMGNAGFMPSTVVLAGVGLKVKGFGLGCLGAGLFSWLGTKEPTRWAETFVF